MLEAIRAGSSHGLAAEYAGIEKGTLAAYLKKDTPRARAFAQQVLEAGAGAAVKMSALVVKAATDGDAKAAQWWLARRHPKEWGERIGVELRVANEREALLDVLERKMRDGVITEAVYRTLLAELAARDNVGDGEDA